MGKCVNHYYEERPAMTAQERSKAMFDLWYEDHIGDENKPVKAAAWEVWQHLYQPVARTPLSDEEAWEIALNSDNAMHAIRLAEAAHHITQEKQG